MKKAKHQIVTFNFSLLALFCAFSFSCYTTRAQNLDSLLSIWQDTNQTDSVRSYAYSRYISKGYLFKYPDSSRALAKELYNFGREQNYPRAEAYAMTIFGISWYLNGNYQKSIENHEKSLKIYLEIGDKKKAANALGNLGVIYGTQGISSKALMYYNKSLMAFEEIGNKRLISTALSNIGTIYENQGQFDKALDYYERSLEMAKEVNSKQILANALSNIGNIYLSRKEYQRALDIYEESLVLSEEIGNKASVVNTYGNISTVLKERGEYKKALSRLDMGLKLSREQNDKLGSANMNIKIGVIYMLQMKYAQAVLYCKDGYDQAAEIGAFIKQMEACDCLYENYKSIGQNDKALVYYELLHAAEDSLQENETSKKLQQMEFKRAMLNDSIVKAEAARLLKEAHQEEMRQEQKTRNIGFGIGGLVLILAGGLYSRLRFVRKSQAILQVEKDRSESLLLNILPADIAAELKEKGKAEARNFERVSILFTDFKGFTEQSAKLSAAELVNEINHCFEVFDGIMEKYGIEKIKTIGDAYMAAGGLPVPTDDSVKNTVLAALEMQAFIVNRKATFDAQNSSPSGRPGGASFEMRVGIHTGPVVAGIVGVKKFQYDIWGDTVNTASRMESNGEVGKVNISQATYELLKDTAIGGTGTSTPLRHCSGQALGVTNQFEFESRGKIEAKGKGEIEMLFVSLNK